MIPTPPDRFDEWLRLPLAQESEDPRFDVRRACPEDFERIYDTVDAAFGKKRPRALYDWLYRRNPQGLARCWIVVEQASGDLLKTGAGFPWPIWRGDEPLMGSLSGDAATLPQWQRRGLSSIRRTVRRSHPWSREMCSISGPNEGSRAVIAKAGDSDDLLGALPGGVVVFRAKPLLERVGLPASLSSAIGSATDGLLASWQHWARRRTRDLDGRVEEIARFTVDFDEVTSRCMSWPLYWCPHNAAFLNWRYLDHPVESFVALAWVEDERPVGYAVLRLAGEDATLSEFAIPVSPRPRALGLLFEVLRVAQEAGATNVSFFASPSWRHWGLFRRAGFLPYRTRNHVEAGCVRFEPEIHDLRNWQILPGDRDFR